MHQIDVGQERLREIQSMPGVMPVLMSETLHGGQMKPRYGQPCDHEQAMRNHQVRTTEH
jgi:hypothetical protein